MIEQLRKFPLATIIVISFYYLVGIIGLSVGKTQPLFQALVPFTLLFSLYFLWLFHEGPDLRIYLTGAGIFLLGFFIEAIGVNTGMIFGEYAYGRTLGFRILDTPLMIGVNWLLLIYSCWALTGIFTGNRYIRYFGGSVLMVLYDIALEPVAIRLDMWSWQGGVIPLQNYAGWFFASALMFLILDRSRSRINNKIAPALFIIQFSFFIILNIIYHFS
jgi:bisanhydrobacterioruberin hydratase